MPSNPDEVYRAIRDAIGESLQTNDVASRTRVAIVTDENVDLSSDFFVQVKPGGGPTETPRVGNQLVNERVEVITWVREHRDVGGKANIRVAGEDKSLFAKLESVRAPLRNSWLDGLLEVPLRQTNAGRPQQSRTATGHVLCRDAWACSYELTSFILYMGWSDVPPTAIAGYFGGQLDASLTISREATDEEYVWAIAPAGLPLVFWHEAGMATFYSPDSLPPTGPQPTTFVEDGVTYALWRSPFANHGISAVYRPRKG